MISDGAVSEFSLLRPPAQPVALTRGGGDLPEPRRRQLLLARAATPSGPRRSRGSSRVICLRLADRGRRSFAADLTPLVAALRAQTLIASGRTADGVARRRRGDAQDRLLRDALFDPTPRRDAVRDRAVDRTAWRARSAIGCRWTAGRSWWRCSTRSASGERAAARRAAAGAGGAPRPRGHDPDRAGGLHVGEHDARGGLALPGHGAAAGARAEHGAGRRAARWPTCATTRPRCWRRCWTPPTAR